MTDTTNGVYVFVALGPNEVEVPCMFFPTREVVDEWMTEHDMVLREQQQYTTMRHTVVPKNGDDLSEWLDEGTEDVWSLSGEELATLTEEQIADAEGGNSRVFFTSYYDGCGGVWAIELRFVPFATPFVPFNLD